MTPWARVRLGVALLGDALLAAAPLAAGCASGAGPAAEPPPSEASAPSARADLAAPVTLRTGAAVRAGEPDPLRVTFEAVEDDSRCPRSVVCVWAGDAAVRLRLDHASGTSVVTLHTALEPRHAAHGGYVVRLLRIAPERESEHTRPPWYEVTLELSRP